MTWDELCKSTGFNFGSLSISISNDKAHRSCSFYKDGNVWCSDSRGCVRLFKECPYNLMYEIIKQLFEELECNTKN